MRSWRKDFGLPVGEGLRPSSISTSGPLSSWTCMTMLSHTVARAVIGVGRSLRFCRCLELALSGQSSIFSARPTGGDRFLQALLAGYETVLRKQYQGDLDLSGGQWQRVALPRAFLRNANLLLLDEPTASTDALSEPQLFELQARAYR